MVQEFGRAMGDPKGEKKMGKQNSGEHPEVYGLRQEDGEWMISRREQTLFWSEMKSSVPTGRTSV